MDPYDHEPGHRLTLPDPQRSAIHYLSGFVHRAFLLPGLLDHVPRFWSDPLTVRHLECGVGGNHRALRGALRGVGRQLRSPQPAGPCRQPDGGRGCPLGIRAARQSGPLVLGICRQPHSQRHG